MYYEPSLFVYFFSFAHSNEQLRDGLLSLVHSYSQLENKLDRHEQRERALGEIIKRGLQTLQKGQKIFEPTRGTLARLDERINQIETLLLGQDEKINEQQTKLNKIIESLEKPSKSSGDADKLTELSNQVEDLSVNVKELRGALDSLTTKHDLDVQNSQSALSNVGQNISRKLDSNAEAIAKIQNSLQDGTSLPDGSIDKITKELQAITTNLGSCGGRSGGEAVDKEFITSLNNQTLEAISEMRHEVLTASDKNFLKTTTKVAEAVAALESNVNDLLKNTGESSCDGIPNALADVKANIHELHKLEQMLAQMGDNVLSVKRGMEFNVLTITSEVNDAIKDNSKILSETIHNQFVAINETILSNHNGAMANLTAKIETEISQVWRQIGIMYQEVSSSRDALNKLQELTETYVNGTSVTMDSMEGKVSYKASITNFLLLKIHFY